MQVNSYEWNKVSSFLDMDFWIENSVIKRDLNDPFGIAMRAFHQYFFVCYK